MHMLLVSVVTKFKTRQIFPLCSSFTLCVGQSNIGFNSLFHPTQAGSQPTVPVPLQVLKPNELFYSKILPLLKEKGMSEQTPRKDWPHQIQLRVLKELMSETPADLLAK